MFANGEPARTARPCSRKTSPGSTTSARSGPIDSVTIGARPSSVQAAGQDEPVADRDDVGELGVAGGALEGGLLLGERRERVELERQRRPGDDEPAVGHRGGRPERLGHAPGEPLAHGHRVVPGRAGHPLAGALVAGAALQEDAGALVAALLDRGPAVAHEVGRDVGRDAQPGGGRVAAVGQDRADRAAVRAVEPDDGHLRVDQALRQGPELLRRTAVAVDGPAVGQLRAPVPGDPFDGPVPDRDPCRDGPVRPPRRRPRRPRSRAPPRSRRRAGAARTAGAAPAGRR